MANTNMVDWKAIGIYAAFFIGGIAVGTFLLGPMVEKIKNKKKTESTTAKA